MQKLCWSMAWVAQFPNDLSLIHISDTTPEKVIADLGDEIFRDPAKVKDNNPYSGYTESSEYISGNIRDKLRIARDHAEHIDNSYNNYRLCTPWDKGAKTWKQL